MSNKTATQIALEVRELWPNLRRRKAEAHASSIMRLLADVIPDDCREDAYYKLLGAFIEAGVDFITDEDRRAAGLEVRLEGGWTATELQILEARKMQLLLGPMESPVFSQPSTGKDK